VHTLYSIAISHYNEKARWALDHYGVAFRERPFMPLFHLPSIAWVTRKASNAKADRVSSRYSTPVLKTDRGRLLCDSSEILDYLEERFGSESSPSARELDHEYSSRLGAWTRRLAYFLLIDETSLMRRVAKNNVGGPQRLLFALAFPLGKNYMKRALRIDPQSAERAKQSVVKVFDEVEKRLADGRPFLLGEHFSRADLSFACMASPLLLVQTHEGYGAWLPPIESLPQRAQEEVDFFRAHPAGQFALRVFRENRQPR
jgi:glutathione S-transferase